MMMIMSMILMMKMKIKLKHLLSESVSIKEFEPVKLEFKFNDYEPHFDEETMRTHYNKHYKGYIEKLNKAIKDENIPIVGDTQLDAARVILNSISQYSTTVRNNAGGYYNHTIFFNGLNPEAKGKIEEGQLKTMIDQQFGSFDKMKDAFIENSLNVFGSGWCWLIHDKGRLFIATTPNQDSPYMAGSGISGDILTGLDVWEHSYYLKYKSDRERYINAFFKLVCWKSAEDRLLTSIKKLTY